MSQCYDISGKLRTNFAPCLPLNTTSPCCGLTDLCMSNGLCLNAEGNQAYTLQGCTSTNWAEPCKKVCSEGDKTDGQGMYYVGYCWDSDPGSGTNDQWCCGHDCCKNQTATKFELPVAKQIYSPGQVSVIPAVTVTTTLSLPPPTGTASSLLTSDSVSRKEYKDIIMALGIPLGFAVISLIPLIFWFVRVRCRRREARGSQATTATATSVGWKQFRSGQHINAPLGNNAAPWVGGSIASPTSHHASHYGRSVNSQPMVEAPGDQSSILSPTSPELPDNQHPRELYP